MVDVVVREAGIEDAEAAATVYVSSAEHHHALEPTFYRVPASEGVVARYREQLREGPGDSVLLVGEVEGRVVGSCEARLMPEPDEASMLIPRRAAELDLATLPVYRGSGVGSKLIAHGERWARERGARRIVLNTHVANGRAISFYTDRHSYRRVGVFLSKDLDGEP